MCQGVNNLPVIVAEALPENAAESAADALQKAAAEPGVSAADALQKPAAESAADALQKADEVHVLEVANGKKKRAASEITGLAVSSAAKRRRVEKDVQSMPAPGEEWLVIPNSVMFSSDVEELLQEENGIWTICGDTPENLQKLKVSMITVMNDDNTFDTEHEEGISRRRLFGRTKSCLEKI